MTMTVSYKVHKTVYNSAEEQQIIPNMQEPMISDDVWERVQVLRNNKRRPTATGRKSLFSGLISDERFMTMMADYESEQRSLKASIAEAEEQLVTAEQNAVDVSMLLKGFRMRPCQNTCGFF